MSIIDTIVQNEIPEDVILFLTKTENGISYPRLDRLYSRNNWAQASNIIELLDIIRKMHDAGLINYGGASIVKGPNWREPIFMTEKKYTS